MKLSLSYRQIFALSAPIMIGSAAQNIIALTDSVFLFRQSEIDFAAIGFVGVFYLIITAIGYGFSRGGQILVARQVGAGQYPQAGANFYSMLILEIVLACLFFAFIHLVAPSLFRFLLESDAILEKSLAYLSYRAWGVFPAFIGVTIIAFYTGIARTKFIMVDTLVLIVVNLFLNYVLIFGKWGFPEMGIAGAGLASTLAEVVALVVFALYMFFDRRLRRFLLRRIPRIDLVVIWKNVRIGSPIVAQAVVALGSWFIFFGIIENMGEKELAISNLVRIVYLILSIPCWGYSVGVNTLVSNVIGQGDMDQVDVAISKTIKVSVLSTLLVSLPVLLFPTTVLYPLFGFGETELLQEAIPIFHILFIILVLFSIGGVYFNGMIGTGASWEGLKMQVISAVIYIIALHLVVNVWQQGLVVSWTLEIFYWLPLIMMIRYYMGRRRWIGLLDRF